MYNLAVVRHLIPPLLLVAALYAGPPKFVDVGEKAGLTFRHLSGSPDKDYTLEAVGGGVAWIDFDRDGR